MPTNHPLANETPDGLRQIFDDLLPTLLGTHAFLDALHLQGVERLKLGWTKEAEQVFRLVQQRASKFPDLAAWAWFKEGEIRRAEGACDAARACFVEALRLSPDHPKARILLCPPGEPLRVSVGQQPAWHTTCGKISFYCNDLDLWRYYLGSRPADELWLTPPLKLLEFHPKVLEEVLSNHLSPFGQVVLARSQDCLVRFTGGELLAMILDGEVNFRTVVMKHLNALLSLRQA
jgi:hypothetical protein